MLILEKVKRTRLYFIGNALFYLSIFALSVAFAVLIYKIYGSDVGGWPLSELLINYAGGFVRRGLLGELYSHCADPVSCAAIYQRVAFSIFAVLTATLFLQFRPQLFLALSMWVIIFSSGGIFDIINVTGYWDRKEIFFYLGMVLMTFSCLWGKPLFFCVTSTIISAILILTHELFFIFFVPIAASAIYLRFTEEKSQLVATVSYLLFCSALFSLTVFYHGDSETASRIVKSIKLANPNAPTEAVVAIGWSFNDSASLSQNLMQFGQIEYWLFSYILASSSLMFLFFSWVSTRRSIFIGVFIFAWLNCAIVISAVSGWDWGRWLSIYSIGGVLSLLMVHSALSNHNSSANRHAALMPQRERFGIVVASTVFLILQSFINVEHCCQQGRSINLMSPISEDSIRYLIGSTPRYIELGNRSVGMANRALDILIESEASDNPEQAIALRQRSVLMLNEALKMLSAAANAGLGGDDGEIIALQIEEVIIKFQEVGAY